MSRMPRNVAAEWSSTTRRTYRTSIERNPAERANRLRKSAFILKRKEKQLRTNRGDDAWVTKKYNPFVLQFKSRRLESNFLTNTCQSLFYTRLMRFWITVIMCFRIPFLIYGAMTRSSSDFLNIVFISYLPAFLLTFLLFGVSKFRVWENFKKRQPLLCVFFITQVALLMVESRMDFSSSRVPTALAAVISLMIIYSSMLFFFLWASVAGWSILIIFHCIFYENLVQGTITQVLVPTLILVIFNAMGMVTAYRIELFERLNFRDMETYVTECKLAHYEEERLDFLLLHVLPARIVGRLKTQPTIAQRVENATVLFICFENLLDLTKDMPSARCIALMNTLFEICDVRSIEYGCEKVKTINEKYMCVSGALDRDNRAQTCAINMADMILAVFKDCKKLHEDGRLPALEIRAGLNSGPIVAGVIGRNKFCWDIWGDTVNTASRMECPKGAITLPGQIRVSEYSMKLLEETHDFKDGGMIEVKGKGEMKTYFLSGRRGYIPFEPNPDYRHITAMELSPKRKVSQSYTKTQTLTVTKTNTVTSSGSRPSNSVPPRENALRNARDFENPRTSAISTVAEKGESISQSIAFSKRASWKPSFMFNGRKSFFTNSRFRSIAPMEMIGFSKSENGVVFGSQAMSPLSHSLFWDQQFKKVKQTLPRTMGLAISVYFIFALIDGMIMWDNFDPIVLVLYMGVVVPIWVLHMGTLFTKYYSIRLFRLLSAGCIIVMAIIAMVVSRLVEESAGASDFTTELSIVRVLYAIFLTYSSFQLPFMDVIKLFIACFLCVVIFQVSGFGVSSNHASFFSYIVVAILLGLYIANAIEFLERNDFTLTKVVRGKQKLLETKRDETDALLQKIVPPNIISSLTSLEDVNKNTRRYQNVSILTADIVGFTAFSESLDAIKLVNTLNSLFTEFDRLAEEHNISKIKTVGDAFVGVGGMFTDFENHIQRLVSMCIEMHLVIDNFNASPRMIKLGQSISLRIGVHVDEVIAGLIGLRKFQYDVFGESVQIADKLETLCTPTYTHLSDSAYKFLMDVSQFDVYDFSEGPGYESSTGTHKSHMLRTPYLSDPDRHRVAKPRSLFPAHTESMSVGTSDQSYLSAMRVPPPRTSVPILPNVPVDSQEQTKITVSVSARRRRGSVLDFLVAGGIRSQRSSIKMQNRVIEQSPDFNGEIPPRRGRRNSIELLQDSNFENLTDVPDQIGHLGQFRLSANFSEGDPDAPERPPASVSGSRRQSEQNKIEIVEPHEIEQMLKSGDEQEMLKKDDEKV